VKRAIYILSLTALLAAVPLQADDFSVVDRALSYLGVPYRFSGTTADRGFDCAGLVQKSFSEVGVNLPRVAADQFRNGEKVCREELKPGDLVFFRNTYKRGISHVGIYIGNELFVHAASTLRRVTIDRLDSPYFASRFAGGRRIERVPVPLTDETVDSILMACVAAL
jgi:cell wall-associated NlpC family hydrolase